MKLLKLQRKPALNKKSLILKLLKAIRGCKRLLM